MGITSTKPEQLLEILASNRELIQQRNKSALEKLKQLNNERAAMQHDDCLLSLELNNSMAQFYFNSNYKKAIENSLKVTEQYNHCYSGFIIWHYWLTGHCYACLGQSENAFNFLNKALEAVWLLPARQPVLTHEIFHSLAMNSHMSKAGVEITLPYLKQALEAIVDTSETVRKANCLTGMGNVYLENELPEKALPNYLKAATMYETKADRQNTAMVYSNIGLCYLNLKNTDEAEKFLTLAMEIQLNASSPEHLSNTYHNLSLLYKEKKYWAKAQYFLDKSRQIFEQTGNKPALEVSQELQLQINSLQAETFPSN